MDIHLARSLVSEQFPNLMINEMTWILEGGDSFTVEVNDSVIFKFPVSNESSIRIVREYHALHFLASRLPGYVAQPLYLGQPSQRFPYPFTGQQKLEGGSGERRKPAPQAYNHMALVSGRLLSTLHAIRADSYAHLNLTHVSIDHPQCKLDQVLTYKNLLRNETLSYEAIPHYLSKQIRIPSVSPLAPVLSHADLKGEHFLLDEQQCHMRGIVDWADICLTDPSVDFAGFAIWLGPMFVSRMLLSYHHEIDEEFLERIVFYARCNTLIHLGESLAEASDAPRDLLLRQLGAAFQIEHSHVRGKR